MSVSSGSFTCYVTATEYWPESLDHCRNSQSLQWLAVGGVSKRSAIATPLGRGNLAQLWRRIGRTPGSSTIEGAGIGPADRAYRRGPIEEKAKLRCIGSQV